MASLTDNKMIGQIKGRLAGAMARPFIAIDFDSRSVRMVRARPSAGSARIDALYSSDMPDDLDLNNAEAVGEFLGQTLKEFSKHAGGSLGRCGVLMSVPRGKAVLKPLTLPPGTPTEEMASMVRFQVEKELPFTPEESVIDFTVASHLDPAEAANGSDQSAGVDVLVGAASREVVEHYRSIAESAGVKLKRLGLRPYANMKCVDACVRREKDETLLAVHITSDETEINVLQDASLAFCRSAAVEIPADKPEKKAKAVDSIVREIILSVHSYSSAQHHGEISALLIAGGTGIEEQVLTRVKSKLGIQCELLNPAGALNLPNDKEASAYSAAIGLAIAHQGQSHPFDFLNPKQPPVKRDARKTRAIVIAASAAFVLLTILVARSMWLGGKEAPLQANQRKIAKLKKTLKGSATLKKRRQEVEKWLDARTSWPSHLAFISQLAPSCELLYLKSDFKSEKSQRKIVFRAYAKGHQVLEDFKARLTDAGYNPTSKGYDKTSKGSRASEQGDYTHSTELTLTVKPGMKIDLSKYKHVPRPADDDSVRLQKSGSSRSGSGGYRRTRSGGARQ